MKQKVVLGFLLLIAVTPTFALPAPKYLAIKDFNLCLQEKNMGTYSTWCMPTKKTTTCPRASWKALKRLKNADKIEKC
ncbi:MAG TPA: hypothetical protein PKC11_06830 [Agitococcus sp.]|nr:hypothetical protein [Agitococcus sp.]HNA21362.1 hypothetical protein [Agitococcus sp.]